MISIMIVAGRYRIASLHIASISISISQPLHWRDGHPPMCGFRRGAMQQRRTRSTQHGMRAVHTRYLGRVLITMRTHQHSHTREWWRWWRWRWRCCCCWRWWWWRCQAWRWCRRRDRAGHGEWRTVMCSATGGFVHQPVAIGTIHDGTDRTG